MFFCQEYLRVAKQLRLIIWRESGENGKIALDDRSPCRRRGLSQQTRAPARLEEIEHHA
jgi:hypothetical protein